MSRSDGGKKSWEIRSKGKSEEEISEMMRNKQPYYWKAQTKGKTPEEVSEMMKDRIKKRVYKKKGEKQI